MEVWTQVRNTVVLYPWKNLISMAKYMPTNTVAEEAGNVGGAQDHGLVKC